ncbi:hypothetical protein ACLB2K_053820 [Fragaria x ananassa]
MPEESKTTVDYRMERASGPHFSGLRLDGLLSSSPPPSSSPASAADSSNLADSAAPKQPFVIGVSGGTASGKTTVCDMIIQQLHDHRVVLVNQDSFYRGLTPEESDRVHEYNFDHPDAFDTEQMLECVQKLKCGQSVQVPIYDFKIHRRSSDSFRQVNASDVIILEGILVFHDQRVRNLMNMKIFVDTDADVRLARRLRRDTVERGRDIDSVLEQYAKFVKPAFDDFVLPSKKYADVIIPRGGDNHVAIDLIVQHIRTKLGQHDLCKIYPNVYVIQSTFQIRGMHTLIRDREISKHDFVFYSDRLIRLVVEHGLGHLPFTEKQVITPPGSVYTGVDFCKKLCGVSIIRSGESMENALRACCKGIKIGKILIHRDGDDGKQLIYEKLPKDISERHVLLLDPVLATGNSANQAIELLIQKGVPESHIIFLNLISAPEGIHCVYKRFPTLKIVTSEIDVALNEEFRVIPGLGEFGDRTSCLHTVTFGFCNADPNVGCMDIERKALLKLREGLSDPSDRLSSWGGVDCCNWRGIGCNKTTGRVESLNLRNPYAEGLDSDGDDGTLHALGGEISPSLLVLKDLVYLDLSMNDFGGLELPSFIGSLEKMTHLNLSGASFGGVIPANLGNLSSLLHLDLSNNIFESDLRWLSSLSSLQFLNLGGADLSKAAPYWLPIVNMLPSLLEFHLRGCGLSILPPALPRINFTSLSVLDLSANGFNSTLSPWLFSLTELVSLDLSSNNLNGELPETLGSLTHLKNLDLSENSNIGGQLPRNLGMLCNLQSLDLSINKVTGEITDFIDSLSRCTNSSLERLDLGYNSLTGNLPSSLGLLKNLRYLTLWYNSFQGSIPESVGNLTSLEEFYLAKNNLGGVIPESFGKLSSLVAVDLSENIWEGVVTEAHFRKLQSLKDVSIQKASPNISLVFNISSNWIPPFKLRYLYLRSCQVGPKFPTWLRNQTELATVVLSNAKITDTIPDWFWQLDLVLEELDVSYNQLSGKVPNSLKFTDLSNADLSSNRYEGPLPLWSPNITTLYLADNQFSGPIPSNIGDVMPSLADLDLSRNGLTGSIPLSLGNLSLLTTMVLSNNYLTGEIPHFWKSIPELYIVDMSNNSLSGTIPRSMDSLVSLRYLILSNNNLSGKLPSLRNRTGMKSLDLGENKFFGNIPAWIGESMLSLLILRLSSNSFTGSIPSQLCGLSNLHILDLSHNKLSGHIPQCVGNLSGLKTSEISDKDTSYLYQGQLEVVSKGRVLEYGSILYLVNSLDLSNNDLSGEMPLDLTSLVMLGTLNLSMNHLTGIIPEKIGNLKSIETLDLSMNQLSGSIPQSMVSLTFVTHLNLSHNNLSGKIPTSNQFNSLVDPSIYQGNAGLCGDPLPTPCQDNEETPQVPSEDREGDDDKSEKAPEGIHCVYKRFPTLKIVTSEIDVALNEEFRVIPGLGEFGDRYFGTDD